MAGLGDKVAGKAKEVEGKVTNDPVREGEGKAQQTKGDLESQGQKASDRVGGAAQEAKGKVEGDPIEEEAGRVRRNAP